MSRLQQLDRTLLKTAVPVIARLTILCNLESKSPADEGDETQCLRLGKNPLCLEAYLGNEAKRSKAKQSKASKARQSKAKRAGRGVYLEAKSNTPGKNPLC